MCLWRGLGLRSERISSSIARRSITTSHIDCESNKGKHVYVCFSEVFSSYKEQKVFRCFSSNDASIQDQAEPAELGLIASTKPQPIDMDQPCNPCARFGHKILHYGSGQQRISWIDTSQRRIRLERSSRTKTEIKSFITAKDAIMWGEIDGKLYCINGTDFWRWYKEQRETSELENLFEVLDPAEKKKKADWWPLASPPHILLHKNEVRGHRALFLEGSKKILAWDYNVPLTCCFDVNHPENGWKELPYDIRPHGARPFVIHHKNHPVLGDFNLFFSYHPRAENPLLIYPFYMSNNCQYFQAIKNAPIQLPEFCWDYLPRNCKGQAAQCDLRSMYCQRNFGVFEFVNMGDQKFGFMLNESPYNDHVYWPYRSDYVGKPAGLLFLLYKYDVVVVNNELEIRTSLIGSRHFRYRSKVDDHCRIYITGAFNM